MFTSKKNISTPLIYYHFIATSVPKQRKILCTLTHCAIVISLRPHFCFQAIIFGVQYVVVRKQGCRHTFSKWYTKLMFDVWFLSLYDGCLYVPICV